MQAKDIMTVNVVTVSEDAPVHEIVSVLLRCRISAVPVIDGARKVVGIVSEGDLLRGEGTSRAIVRHPWWLEAIFVGQTVTYENARGRLAGAVMTRNVITVDEDAPLNEIAGQRGRGRSSRNEPGALELAARRYACRGSAARAGGCRKSR